MAAVMVALSHTHCASEFSALLGCNATSLGNQFLMFEDNVVVSSLGVGKITALFHKIRNPLLSDTVS
jgi:hypothetical protein